MSSARVLRPALSLRYQTLRRISSKASVETPAAHSSSASTNGFLRRNRGRIIWSITGLSLGLVCGNFIVHTVSPPALPDAGTPGDQVLIADLNRRIDNEFKVQVLRGKCLGVSRQLKGQQGGWVELIKSKDDTIPGLKSTLSAAKALGVERLFWHREQEKLVAVVWFGGSVSGWPGVTHGGIIATQMLEKIGMVAALMHGANRDTSEAAVPQRLPGTGSHATMLLAAQDIDEPQELSLSYVKPTYANGFYVIRAAQTVSLDHDPEHIVPTEPRAGHDYEATLETMDAKVLVKAKARVYSSALESLGRSAEAAAGWTTEQFKLWMWPSRQTNSQP